MTVDLEVWKPIPSTNGEYEASNLGRVRSTYKLFVKSNGTAFIRKEKILKCWEVHHEYLRVAFYVNGKRWTTGVHRAVAEAFHENPDNLPEVNHINAISNDNRAINLEWCSRRENVLHSWRMGLCPVKRGELNGMAKLTEEKVRAIRREYVPFKVTAKNLSEKYNVPLGSVKNILKRKYWKHVA